MNKLKLIAITLFFNSFLQAQETSSLYINYKILDELSIGYEKKISNRLSLSADIGYNFGGAERIYADNGFILYPKNLYLQFADYGAIFNFNINLLSHNDQRWSLNYFYRNLKSKLLIVDPGKYAGSNTSNYELYNKQSKDNGLLFMYSIQLNPSILLYCGVGVQMAFVEKEYIISGFYTDKEPSNRVSKNDEYRAISKIGFLWNVWDL